MDHKDKNKLASVLICITILCCMAVAFVYAVRVGLGISVRNAVTAPTEPVLNEEIETPQDKNALGAEDSMSEHTSESPKTEQTALTKTTETLTESELNAVVSWLDKNEGVGHIDYSKSLYKPGKRDIKAKWDASLYSRLENVADPNHAQINTYEFSKRQVTMEDGKELAYEVYRNPENDNIEKISTIEYCGDDLEVTDYYYDEGKVNYIFKHRDLVNIPIDISNQAVGNRYYFSNDTMVRLTTNNGAEAVNLLAEKTSTYSQGTIDEYNYIEADLINRAYITYQAVQDIPEAAFIEGYVVDEMNTPLSEAEVEIYSEHLKKTVRTVMTDGDGYYKASVPVDNKGSYTITVDKKTLKNVRIYDIPIHSGTLQTYMRTIYMAYEESGKEYATAIELLDANDKSKLSGADLTIREGVNNRTGDVKFTVKTDNSGKASLSLRSGTYTGEIVKKGYAKSYFVFNAKADISLVTGYSVPEVKDGEYSIALNWQDQTLALNSYLFTPDISRGPVLNNITFKKSNGYYKYYVSDWTSFQNQNTMSYTMTNSGAEVQIYNKDGLQQTYYVVPNSLGVVWEVFEIRNGIVAPIQGYYPLFEEKLFQ